MIFQYKNVLIQKVQIVLIIVIVGTSNIALAQHKENKTEEHVFKNERKNIVMLSFGYSYVPEGAALDENQSDGIFVPSIGIDYKRRISEKWALALFTDLELDHYLIIDKDFERERAFIAVLGANYEIAEGLGSFAGAGAEFEKNESLWILRLGIEYGFNLGKNWVMVPSIFCDWKEQYTTFSSSIGVSYKF